MRHLQIILLADEWQTSKNKRNGGRVTEEYPQTGKNWQRVHYENMHDEDKNNEATFKRKVPVYSPFHEKKNLVHQFMTSLPSYIVTENKIIENK